jgi:hypothetical protein
VRGEAALTLEDLVAAARAVAAVKAGGAPESREALAWTIRLRARAAFFRRDASGGAAAAAAALRAERSCGQASPRELLRAGAAVCATWAADSPQETLRREP